MKKSDFESFQRGMAQAHAFIEGERKGFVVHQPVDIRRVRTGLKLTRDAFASKFGLNPRTIEQWEQGRSRPDRNTETYLRLIERNPDAVAKMVSSLPA